MGGMDSNANATKMLRLLRKVAKQVVDKERPDLRVGMVHSYDRISQTAYVLFPGGTVPENLVPVRFALDKIPSVSMESDADGIGDVVRVAGKPGAWFILDYVTGAPLNQAIDAVINTPNIAWEEETFGVTGPGRQDYFLKHSPIEKSDTLHWWGIFQDRTIWERVGRYVTVIDAEEDLDVGDKITIRYAYIPDPNEQRTKTNFTYAGHSRVYLAGVSGGEKTATEHPLPAGLVKGDMLVLVLEGRQGGGVCTDARMKKVGSYTNGTITSNTYIGYYDGVNNAPLAILLKNQNSAVGQFALSECAAYRGDYDINTGENQPIRYDPARIVAVASVGLGADIPAVPTGEGSGSIRVALGWSGIGGVNYDTSRTGITWDITPDNSAYLTIGIAKTLEDKPVGLPTPYTDADDLTWQMTIGII